MAINLFFNNLIFISLIVSLFTIYYKDLKLFLSNKYFFLFEEDEFCPLIPPNLGQRIPVDLTKTNFTQINKELKYLNIELGGHYKPSNCRALHKVAIIMPYRNRYDNLTSLLRHLHPFLHKQFIDYGIYVIEPQKELVFNRALLMNIGFVESLKLTNQKWDCFIFHDVDLFPEDERNLYICPDEMPRHLSSAVSTFDYKTLFGGVTALTKQQFLRINGFSNLFFGWGGEDDDLYKRVVGSGYKITRYSYEIGRYYTQKNQRQKPTPNVNKLLETSIWRMSRDGLNTLKYDLIGITKYPLFTHIMVSYNQREIMYKYEDTEDYFKDVDYDL